MATATATNPLRLRMDRIILFAPDLEKAKQFYTQVLGFELVGENECQLWLKCGDLAVDIFRCLRHRSPQDHSYEAGCAVAFQVTNLTAAVRHLQAHDVRILHETPGSNQSGEYVAFCDPFGTVHELLQLKGSR